jgi:drug/metabolite transporter (DMT)-like permease
MLPAVLAATLFAFSAVVSQRSSRIFGAVPANFFRMAIACAVLGLITWVVDATRGLSSLHAPLFRQFLLSGLVGYGIGDIALFLAYARLGSRLTILINWCSAALFAAAGDYFMRRHALTPAQWIAVGCILGGLIIALWPSERTHHPASGVIFAIIAGIGMGLGTVLSGQAIDTAHTMGLEVHALSQTFQRSIAGVAAAALAFLLVKYLPQRRPVDVERKWRHKPFWLLSTALFGPVLGVSCYQWALTELGSSTIVVAIASTSTLLVIPLARMVEKDKPRTRQILGSILAAAGVVVLKLFA